MLIVSFFDWFGFNPLFVAIKVKVTLDSCCLLMIGQAGVQSTALLPGCYGTDSGSK